MPDVRKQHNVFIEVTPTKPLHGNWVQMAQDKKKKDRELQARQGEKTSN